MAMKELSIEEKAKAYDKALERVKNIKTGKCETTFIFTVGLFEYIFPELKESEQENAYIAFIKAAIEDYYDENNPLRKELVAWLEKQGEQKHLELKAGHWYFCHSAYCCRADHLTVKEGERFQCEKDGVVKGFVIKDPEKYFSEISVPHHSEDAQTDEVRRRSTIQVLEYARSLDNYNQYGKADIDKNIAWLEKQGLQNLAKSAKTCKDEQPAWSEDDEIGLADALWCCKQAASIAKDENDMGNAWYAENWLKSLKNRIGG